MQTMQSANENEDQDKKPPLKVIVSSHNQNLDYDAVKAQALKESPVVASYPLSSFELGRNQTIKLNGKLIPVTPRAYNNFLKKVLRIEPNFVKRFKSNTDEKTEISMLQALKSGMSMKKQQQVHILANPKNQEITAFSSGKHMFRTNEALLAIFENVMNSFNKLELRDFYMMEDGTMNLSARSNEETFGTIQSEVFRGGLTFRNSYDSGSFIGHNALRMICMNGMFGFRDLPLFVGPGDSALLSFFEKLRELDNNHWMEENFWDKMDGAMNTNASVAELNWARNTMIGNSGLAKEELRNFLPEYQSAVQWLAKRGVNIETLNNQQEKNCPTNINLWKLINQVTDFGSHDYGYEADFGRIQKAAGGLFVKEPDAKNLVIFK